ncbi:MAG: MFS transporter [Verrucomicrobia bacterium]|nr:MFS transporter [Verrucomicrobiota bacterium]MBV9275115.1 MFS transporter [Verrucomicrobiota bacterium]
MSAAPTTAAAPVERIYPKVALRLLPLLFLCYVVAYLDRINVGFAKLQMQSDLHLSDSVYGLASGIFFFGYLLFEVPSNLLLERIGARLWIARIMISWGIISGATLFVTSAGAFYALRFLLGFAEAGFFPGIILYLTYWFPSRWRAQIVAWFMTAVAVTGVVGNPLSGWILHELTGFAGLRGWQMIFLVEAIPAMVLGIIVPFVLPNGIRSARWLTDSEKETLEANIHVENAVKSRLPLARVFIEPKLLTLSLIYFCNSLGLYGIGFWLPQIIKNTGVNDPLQVGLLSAIPYGFAAVAMVLFGRSSDRTHERRWHYFGGSVVGAVGLVMTGMYGHSTLLTMAGVTLSSMGVLSLFPVFWPIPAGMLAGTSAAAGIAWINSLGGLAGFFGPTIVGTVTDLTKKPDFAFYLIAGAVLLGGVLVLAIVPRTKRQRQ